MIIPSRTTVLRKSLQNFEKLVKSFWKEPLVHICAKWESSAQWSKPWTITTKDSDFSTELQNILDEQFNPDRPNTVWCSDITYIWTIDGFVYLTSVMDLFSRKIIAWTFSETLEVSCMIDTINNIVKTPEGAAVDNDGQLTSINAESYASMNMWGLTPEFMQILENGFKEFFANMGDKDILKAEYLLPIYIDE